MATNGIVQEDTASVRLILIDKPRTQNALTVAMRTDLCERLADADRDRSISAVVLSGRDPAFCAGIDFKERVDGYDPYWVQFQPNPGSVLRAMTKPVIAAVNGPCVSGGLEMALSSSFILASDRASFADTHASLGVLPKWGLSALLPRAVGVRIAREMSLTGCFVGSNEALAMGLVNRVVPHEKLVSQAVELAGKCAKTEAAVTLLSMLKSGEDLSLQAALALEARSQIEFDPDAFTREGSALVARQRGGVSRAEAPDVEGEVPASEPTEEGCHE
jgi:enoyl-CoA hydratase